MTDLFIDGTLKICNHDIAAFETLTHELAAFVEKFGLNLTMTVSMREEDIPESEECEQLDFFTDAAEEERRRRQSAAEEREKRRQQAILKIQKRFGKNAIFKGMNLQEGATTIARNGQIGGHKA